jgi:hypothetical protein
VEPFGKSRTTDVEGVRQYAHGLCDLSQGHDPLRVEQAPQQPQQTDLVADVVQRHRRPNQVHRLEAVDAVGKLGEVGGDSPFEPVLAGALRGPGQHRRRPVEGDDPGLGEQPGQLAGADTRPAPYVEHPAHRRRLRRAQRLDLFHCAGDEADQHFTFELRLPCELPPVSLVEVHRPVVMLVGSHVGQPTPHQLARSLK